MDECNVGFNVSRGQQISLGEPGLFHLTEDAKFTNKLIQEVNRVGEENLNDFYVKWKGTDVSLIKKKSIRGFLYGVVSKKVSGLTILNDYAK